MIRSVYLLPYNLGTSYLVHTLILVRHVTPDLDLILQSTLLHLGHVLMIRSVSLLLYIVLSYLVHTLIIEGTCICHLTLTSFYGPLCYIYVSNLWLGQFLLLYNRVSLYMFPTLIMEGTCACQPVWCHMTLI